MNAPAVAEAIVEWAKEAAPGILGTYDHAPKRKDQPLPDLACEIVAESRDPGPPPALESVPLLALMEVAAWHTFQAELWIVVEPEPAEDRAEELGDFVGQLGDALQIEGTQITEGLWASPLFQATYRPPFVEFDDGQKGRLAVFRMTVSEPVTD